VSGAVAVGAGGAGTAVFGAVAEGGAAAVVVALPEHAESSNAAGAPSAVRTSVRRGSAVSGMSYLSAARRPP
jgi:shikimate 5-dehydrogenase